MNRMTQRYGYAPARQCITGGCSQTASPNSLSGRCWRCVGRLRRLGDALQELPETYTLDAYVRRMEEARGALKLLDLDALEARWTDLVAECRGRAVPSFKTRKRLSYNVWQQEASAIIRDLGDALSFTRALDLLGAIHLLAIERPQTFRSEDALACCVVELFRRAANVGRRWGKTRAVDGLQPSYRVEVAKQTRLETARYLNIGLGAAAAALAKRAAEKADQAKQVRSDYYAAVAAIEQSASI
jgi:hypothetical protein